MSAVSRQGFWARQPTIKSKVEISSSCQSLITVSDGGSLSPNNSNHSRFENTEVECLKRLKGYFQRESSPRQISDETIFRFANYYNFQYRDAFAAIQESHKNPRLHLRMNEDLITKFESKILFPLPGLKTRRNKCDVIYMRQSRFVPKTEKKTGGLLDILCYVLNDMSRTKEQCQKGVALIVNMKGWTMKNFSQESCEQFIQALQGKQVPTKVDLFLIVNAPASFDNVVKIMKPMFSRSFAKKVHMIKDSRLNEFLMDGYEQYLPDDFANGWRDTDELLEDLIDLKQYEDKLKEDAIQTQRQASCGTLWQVHGGIGMMVATPQNFPL